MMITLIIGGSPSGKSEFAEGYAYQRYMKLKSSAELLNGGKHRSLYEGELIYLATMINSDDETRERIKKHIERRSGMGYKTLEVPKDLDEALSSIDKANCVILLECLSNLLSNEMFGSSLRGGYSEISDKIFSELMTLKNAGHDLVIVSNDVFRDGEEYSNETAKYIDLLGGLNRRLAAQCDEVYEVVLGIPVRIKGSLCENDPESGGRKLGRIVHSDMRNYLKWD